ncbi:uncharacterized protein LOC120425426 [Culex pipiens pallens]|uniref:uncharacterized protein LOC120425426 n=1 Tax=Culex pipiens pallens TaxID=42434 RepID=UPI0019546BA6|nr:uncharacterized protein LOC120425426 [Culex pipiens pallens]
MTPKLGDAPLTNVPWRAVICFQSHACSILFVSIVFGPRFGRCLIEKVLVKSRVLVKKATSGVCPTRSWTNLPGDRTGTALGWRNFFIFGDFFYQARRLLRTLPAGFVQDGRFVWRRKSLEAYFTKDCASQISESPQ